MRVKSFWNIFDNFIKLWTRNGKGRTRRQTEDKKTMAETKPNVANNGNNSHEKTDTGNIVYQRNLIYIWDDDITPGFRQIPWAAPPQLWDNKPTTSGRKKKKKKKKH